MKKLVEQLNDCISLYSLNKHCQKYNTPEETGKLCTFLSTRIKESPVTSHESDEIGFRLAFTNECFKIKEFSEERKLNLFNIVNQLIKDIREALVTEAFNNRYYLIAFTVKNGSIVIEVAPR